MVFRRRVLLVFKIFLVVVGVSAHPAFWIEINCIKPLQISQCVTYRGSFSKRRCCNSWWRSRFWLFSVRWLLPSCFLDCNVLCYKRIFFLTYLQWEWVCQLPMYKNLHWGQLSVDIYLDISALKWIELWRSHPAILT